MKRRAVLACALSLSTFTAGCSIPAVDDKEFRLGPIQVENRDARPRRVAVAVEDRDEVVFLDSVTASPAEWDGDDLVRQGGITIEDPVSSPGRYAVHVRVGDGPIRTSDVTEVVSDGGCVSVRPNVERDGAFHFEYAYPDCSGE